MLSTERSSIVRILGFAAVGFLLANRPAFAADPVLTCQLAKTKAAGARGNCLAAERAKALKGKPFDLQSCETKFDDAIAKADTAAANKGATCRYLDNGDGTAIDLNTLLTWEQKTGIIGTPNTLDVHDVNNTYTLSVSYPWMSTGTAYTDFLSTLNNATSPDALSTYGCFTLHCDWRLPTIEELRSLVDFSQGVCSGGSGACIDPTLGPMQACASVGDQLVGQYWSLSTQSGAPEMAWPVIFWAGGNMAAQKDTPLYVRAVRGGRN